jgi:hypothetical protein
MIKGNVVNLTWHKSYYPPPFFHSRTPASPSFSHLVSSDHHFERNEDSGCSYAKFASKLDQMVFTCCTASGKIVSMVERGNRSGNKLSTHLITHCDWQAIWIQQMLSIFVLFEVSEQPGNNR